ncbi:hypothetical protein SAMN06298210_1031, partial [Prevotellaceae bacterium KH2P17]
MWKYSCQVFLLSALRVDSCLPDAKLIIFCFL